MSATFRSWLVSAPDRWTRGRLKDLISSAINGVWGDEPAEDDTDVYCVRAADFDRRRNLVNRVNLPRRHIDRQTMRRHLLRKGDLILEKSGGGETQLVGAAVIFDLEVLAVCSNFCARLRPAGDVDSRYLSYALAASYHMGLTGRSIKQTTGIQNLDSRSFFSEQWATPSLAEQGRIADFLDAESLRVETLDARMRLVSRLLDERRVSALAEVYDESSSRFARSDYRIVPLRRVVLKWIDYRGATPQKTESGVPLVTAGSIKAGRINLEDNPEFIGSDDYGDWMRRGLPVVGDVLLTTEAPLGQVAVVADPWIALAQRVILLRPDLSMISSQWLYWYLQSPQGLHELVRRATGSTALGIKADRLRGVPIRIFSNSEMLRRISWLRDAIGEIDEISIRVDRQRRLLSERRRALITAAVTGRIDVTTARGVEA